MTLLALALSLPGKGDSPEKGNQSDQEKSKMARTDLYGDRLPAGALARLGTVRFRQEAVEVVAFSPNGCVVASGGRALCFWYADTGRLHRRLFPEDLISSLAFSSDGKRLVMGGRLGLLDVATGKEESLQRVRGYYRCAALSPDGRIVAAGQSITSPCSVTLWDVATRKTLRTMEGHKAEVASVAFSPDGKVLASASHDKTVRLWDVATGKERRKLEGHQDLVYRVVFSPDGKFLASAGKDAVIRLWDWKSGKELHKLEGHDWPVHCLAFSPDGKFLVSGAADGILRLWDMGWLKSLRQWHSPTILVTSVAFSPNGKVLASSAAYDQVVRFWNPATGREIHPPPGHTGPVRAIEFLPGDRELISVGEDRKALLWDLSSGTERRRLFDAYSSLGAGLEWNACAVCPDRKLFAFGKQTILRAKADPVVHVWDTEKGKEILALRQHTKALMSLAFSKDGRFLASGDMGGTLCLWELAGKELRWSKELSRLVRAIVFSADGKRLATYDDGNLIRLWEVATGKNLHRWKQSSTSANQLVFSWDSRLLASTDSETTRVWSVSTGQEVSRLSNGSWCLTFSPSGRVLAAGGMNSTDVPEEGISRVGIIRLWEVVSGQEIRQLEGDQFSVDCLAFSSNGQTLAAGGLNTTILLWDLTGGKARRLNELNTNELQRLWIDMGDKAPQAYQAIWKLVAAPQQATLFLKEHLKPTAPADPRRIQILVAKLNDESFAEREKATKELEGLAELAGPPLRKVLSEKPPPEVKRRAEGLLNQLDGVVTSPERLRPLRAVEVLEHIGTPEAQEVLRILAKGAAQARLTEETKATLGRLAKRHAAEP